MQRIIIFLSLLTFSIWICVFSINDNLQIIACDVGQGDAILIQKKTTQILIDGGPNSEVLTCLGKYMPLGDDKIEMVINTHPEVDHYTGLIDVFKRYKVDNFGINGATSSSQGYKVLETLVGGSGAKSVVLTKGTSIKVGMIYLDILNPITNNQITNNQIKINKTNNNGVVILLKYAQFKALFTADVENEVGDILAEEEKIKNLNYIKVSHHGSKNGMTENLLKTVNPEVAVISVGVRNNYGHPHAEILEMLRNQNVKILRTDEIGDVIIKI
jgi:competence protein ComEC